ncbi:DMT family transporter [Shimia marina]|uniref:Putative DMT superfamily transporter inner membrane protein n=1 Tax=Shimia marina TaxID=321267 RepID=A0A0P1FB97_9RHOB|nr:DMT family transporter [Shimia marina]CUH52546.1 putative DMT superfamily transporter inner membrane protein [Shimia marina]SFE49605.1 Permease of the drug/metabolite transporter (DMT) superfamily [Shimia marina]
MTRDPEITAGSWLMVGTLGLVWGGTFMVQKLALDHMAPIWVAAGRISFAALITAFIWRLRGGGMFTTQITDWPRLIWVSMLSAAIPFMFLAWAQQHVSSAFTGVSMAAVALIVLPLAHFFVPGERMTLRRTFGFLIGFAGVLLLIGPAAFASSGAALESLGQLACLTAASCYAVSSILMRRLPPIDPIGLSAATLMFGAILVVPLALIKAGIPPMPAPEGVAIVAALGLIPTAAAGLLRILVIRTAGPVFMSLTNYQVPLWSVVFGVTLMGEPVPGSLIWAALLILSGVGLSQYGALRRLFTQQG